MFSLLRFVVASSAFILFASAANAELSPTEKATEIIRVCAPSQNIYLKLQGEVGGFIARKLAGAQASGDATIFQDGELLQIMIAASPEDATQIYKMYLDCVDKRTGVAARQFSALSAQHLGIYDVKNPTCKSSGTTVVCSVEVRSRNGPQRFGLRKTTSLIAGNQAHVLSSFDALGKLYKFKSRARRQWLTENSLPSEIWVKIALNFRNVSELPRLLILQEPNGDKVEFKL